MKISTNTSSQSGFMSVFIIIFVFLFLVLGADLTFIYLKENCHNLSALECFQEIRDPNNDDQNNPEKSITATGTFSKDKYSVNVVLNIPLDGGEFRGSFNGSCNGKIRGNYSGGESGSLSGSANGSCTSPVLIPVPASANFTGSVNQASKQVPISGTGSALGFSGEGSLTLSY